MQIYPSLYNIGAQYPNTCDTVDFYIIKSRKGSVLAFPTDEDDAAS